jgi:hypothetical protein
MLRVPCVSGCRETDECFMSTQISSAFSDRLRPLLLRMGLRAGRVLSGVELSSGPVVGGDSNLGVDGGVERGVDRQRSGSDAAGSTGAGCGLPTGGWVGVADGAQGDAGGGVLAAAGSQRAGTQRVIGVGIGVVVMVRRAGIVGAVRLAVLMGLTELMGLAVLVRMALALGWP